MTHLHAIKYVGFILIDTLPNSNLNDKVEFRSQVAYHCEIIFLPYAMPKFFINFYGSINKILLSFHLCSC
jgi:hypothetical protein